MSTHTVEPLGLISHRDRHLISLEFRLPLRISCVPGLLARNGISRGRAQLPQYCWLLMSNLSIVCILASFRNHGCSDRPAQCFVSCLTRAAVLFLKNVIPSSAAYDRKASYCSRTVVPGCICRHFCLELYGQQ